jgi:hypothetical protein
MQLEKLAVPALTSTLPGSTLTLARNRSGLNAEELQERALLIQNDTLPDH